MSFWKGAAEETALGMIQKGIGIYGKYLEEKKDSRIVMATNTAEFLGFYLTQTEHHRVLIVRNARFHLVWQGLPLLQNHFQFFEFPGFVEFTEKILEFLGNAQTPTFKEMNPAPAPVRNYLEALHQYWRNVPDPQGDSDLVRAYEGFKGLVEPLVRALCNWQLSHLLENDAMGQEAVLCLQAWLESRNYTVQQALEATKAMCAGKASEKEAERQAGITLAFLLVASVKNGSEGGLRDAMKNVALAVIPHD